MLRLLRAASLHLIILLAAGNAYALVEFDFEQKFFREPGVPIKDHSLIRVGSTYHLFYLRGFPAINIGHATSTDLIHWNLEEPVLYVQQGEWDEMALWAPHVIKHENYYYMYYTGVNSYWAQQTGGALSLDLYLWSKLPWPLYHPSPVWAEWSETAWSHGRDPFVFSYGSRFYMLVTAKTNFNKGAIASAVSDNLITWEDNGPLYVHDSWHVLESVQLIQRNNKFHLFFTEEVINGTSHMASDFLYSGWDISTRVLIDAGHAPEVNEFDGNYIISRHAVYNDNFGTSHFVIVLDTLRWAGNFPYVHKPWTLWGNWNLIWGNAFIYQPTYGDNLHARGDTVDANFEGNCWIGTYERYMGPLKYGTPGGYQGDGTTGIIRSKQFTITGNSMNMLVGGGDYPDDCYVALVDAATGQVFYKETGKNTDHMDRRYWDLTPYKGTEVYIEIADLSSGNFGHINCDDIRESMEYVDGDPRASGRPCKRKFRATSTFDEGKGAKPSAPALYQNTPNPFNPATTISYYLPLESRVVLEIFDVRGRSIVKLVNQKESTGRHDVVWDGLNRLGEKPSSGIYFYRLSIDGRVVDTKKMALIK